MATKSTKAKSKSKSKPKVKAKPKPKPATADDFLDAHKLEENVYVTGIFYPGITIYNQQVRTLNLVYFLKEKKVLDEPAKVGNIVVVGGGISGLTAAMALKRLGYLVTLLEEKSLLLHLQHGCTTRQIHPNLALWPKPESLKPFTELPFANWSAGDASSVEKTLIKEFEDERAMPNGRLEVIYNIDGAATRVFDKAQEITYVVDDKEERLTYSLLLLATGFGLEKYVGKKEITKSYWRNEDFAQLRVKDQTSNFFISGVGDGGVSDIFRLTIIGFEPSEMAKEFEKIQNKDEKLIDRLRTLQHNARNSGVHNFEVEFNDAYDEFSEEIDALIQSMRRSDVENITLNGKDPIARIYSKDKMLFINAWILFVLAKLETFTYHEGEFPDKCGKYIFNSDPEQEFHIIIRHGTDRNMDHFKSLNREFDGLSKKIAEKQEAKEMNDFSVKKHWGLEYWYPSGNPAEYIAKRFFVSPILEKYCYTFLKSLEGIIRYFAIENSITNFTFRMTLHRLVCYSDEHLFQQACCYVGHRTGGEPGRAFPLSEGMVGLAMRTNTCFSLMRQEENEKLFRYSQLYARTLEPSVTSFLVVPIPSADKQAALCFYFDSSEKQLVIMPEFRERIYAALSYFVKFLDEGNLEERMITMAASKKPDDLALLKEPGIETYENEMRKYRAEGDLKMATNKMIDIYER